MPNNRGDPSSRLCCHWSWHVLVAGGRRLLWPAHHFHDDQRVHASGQRLRGAGGAGVGHSYIPNARSLEKPFPLPPIQHGLAWGLGRIGEHPLTVDPSHQSSPAANRSGACALLWSRRAPARARAGKWTARRLRALIGSTVTKLSSVCFEHSAGLEPEALVGAEPQSHGAWQSLRRTLNGASSQVDVLPESPRASPCCTPAPRPRASARRCTPRSG